MIQDETRTGVRSRHPRTTLALSAVLAISVAGCGSAAEAGDGDNLPVVLHAEATEVRTDNGTVASPWAPGECDGVYEFRAHGPGGPGTPFSVPPGSEIHPQIYFDAPWGDEPAQVVAWKPLTDNKKVLHHWIVWQGQANLMGWAPGGTGVPTPTDIGTELPGGTDSLRLDMHYYNLTGGVPELDRSGVVICVVKGANLRKKVAAVHGGFNIFSPVMVPASTRGYELKGQCTVKSTEPVTVLSVSPHAHTRARHMKLTVVKPDGREFVLHEGGFSFYEQVGYRLDPAFILENGDTVHVMCRYDNETNKTISWGEGTQDEMCIHWANYYPKGGFTCGPMNFFPARPATTP